LNNYRKVGNAHHSKEDYPFNEVFDQLREIQTKLNSQGSQFILEHNVKRLVEMYESLEKKMNDHISEGQNSLLDFIQSEMKAFEKKLDKVDFEMTMHREGPEGSGHANDYQLFTMSYRDKGAIILLKCEKSKAEKFAPELKARLLEQFPAKNFVILYGEEIEIVKV